MDTMQTLDKLAARDNTEPGDYIKDGLLMCGKCQTPKQVRQEIAKLGGGTSSRLLPIICQCKCEEREKGNEQFRREQFRANMDGLQKKFGITDRAYRKFTFAADDRREVKLSDTCRRYVERWDKVRADNIGLLLYGTVGTGKSFYASAIVNALLEKCVSAAVTNFPRLLNLLNSTKNRQECIDHLQSYHLLVIDDLGVERDSSYAAEQVFNVIDDRARSGLPLIITTNMTMEELKKPPTMQYARIYDRVLELCPVALKMVGESRRVGNAAVRTAIAREILGA